MYGASGDTTVINKEAVKHVRVGKALGGRLADFSEFDRKNYFIPIFLKVSKLVNLNIH